MTVPVYTYKEQSIARYWHPFEMHCYEWFQLCQPCWQVEMFPPGCGLLETD